MRLCVCVHARVSVCVYGYPLCVCASFSLCLSVSHSLILSVSLRLQVNESVWVKVINVQPDANKFGLSLRAVNQSMRVAMRDPSARQGGARAHVHVCVYVCFYLLLSLCG
jgi:hypothetical protein